LAKLQNNFCTERCVSCVPTLSSSILGYALSTNGLLPINGLRHPVQGDTSGWYVWSGSDFSSADDFFQPIHTEHLIERYSDVARLLGLPPGYRFLLAGDYLDIWYDASLLEVD
jgi:hypothetical protein